MTNYVANPVRVLALAITGVGPKDEDGNTPVHLDNGEDMLAKADMTARYHPKVGDYWVEQSDGYVYLNPKDVFERKYRPIQDDTEDLLARAAYAGYLEASGGKSLVSGAPLPTFSAQDPRIQAAWKAAACAVRDEVEGRLIGTRS